jgi:hypothetical protein
MSYSKVNHETENVGSMHMEKITINIDSLASAGGEPFTPSNETKLISDAKLVTVTGQADPGYNVTWDHTTGEVAVTETAGSTGPLADVGSTTAVGEVELTIMGS